MEQKKAKSSKRSASGFTMDDLAKVTGLSKMTVSRVFADSKNVRESTRQKVLEAADRLGYEYNALAGSFASGRSGLIGIGVDVRDLMGSAYFARLFNGAHGQLEDAGYRSVIFDTASEEFSDAPRLARLVTQRRVEGLLAIVPRHESLFLSTFNREHTSLVVMGARCKEPSIPWVDLDNPHAVKLLVEHLYGLGHRAIGFIAGPPTITDAQEREQSFLALREKHGLRWNDSWQQCGDFRFGGGRDACRAILAAGDRPTAIICTNDISALGACEAAKDAGLSVGKDISIAGIDGSVFAEEAEPPITTIAQPLERMGRRAATILLATLDNAPMQDETISAIFQGELLDRASTGPAPD